MNMEQDIFLDCLIRSVSFAPIQVGEEKLVLQIGQKSLQHPDAKPYVHDLLLSMALAEVRQRGRDPDFVPFHF